MPGLARAQWMLAFAGWNRNYLVTMCIYFLVSGSSLLWLGFNYLFFNYTVNTLFISWLKPLPDLKKGNNETK